MPQCMTAATEAVFAVAIHAMIREFKDTCSAWTNPEDLALPSLGRKEWAVGIIAGNKTLHIKP